MGGCHAQTNTLHSSAPLISATHQRHSSAPLISAIRSLRNRLVTAATTDGRYSSAPRYASNMHQRHTTASAPWAGSPEGADAAIAYTRNRRHDRRPLLISATVCIEYASAPAYNSLRNRLVTAAATDGRYSSAPRYASNMHQRHTTASAYIAPVAIRKITINEC
jgi:hypothetical protein